MGITGAEVNGTAFESGELACLRQVDARQIAGAVVHKHVFRAGVAGVDPPAGGTSVPAVDGGVKLDAGIAANPGGLGNLLH